tara:strand:- start:1386 stop:1778 length:393 start_codon:yes stop_codon:yes gene_type:complete
MQQKDNVFTIKLVKKDGKLIHQNTADLSLFKDFVNGMEEDQIVEVFFEAHKDDGTNPQLAKIHASIRKLAMEIGYTFEEMKMEIKRQSGLCWDGNDGRTYCKSFAECSKEELSLVIEALNQAGETVNIQF